MLVLLAAAGFAVVGFLTIRRDVDNLRVISQDNTQWSATQMEVELLRFRLALSQLREARTPETLAEMYARFDILWSRVFMMGHGQVGESLRRYDAEHGSVAAIAAYLSEIDPAVEAVRLRRRRRHRRGRAEARRVPGGAPRVHAPGAARRRRRGRAGARAHQGERAHDGDDQRRGGPGQRPVALPDPAREPPAACARAGGAAQRRARRAGEPRQVAVPDDDEPRVAQPAQRRPRAARAPRAGRPRRAPAPAGGAGAETPGGRCCRC